MPLQLPAEKKQRLVESIKRFFLEEWEEEIGDLKASLVLDFCVKEIGPTLYNRAIADAQAYLQDRVGDLDGACYEPEFGYWKKK